jgi:uncharacterized protein
MKLKQIITLFLFCFLAIITKAQQPTQNDLFSQATKYYYGVGVIKDEKRAFFLYLQSALAGYNQAMNRVAIFYREGIGTTANKQLAIQWFTKSGEAGYANGFYNLANLYKDAKGSEQDFTKAYLYFTKGANMNDPQSIYAKGYMLFKGLGCTQNYTEAVEYFKQASINQLPVSMYFLGLCFRNGYGITANKDSAAYWLQKAQLKGERMAIQELKSIEPENNNPQLTTFANELKQKTLKSKKGSVNKVEKITNSIEANVIEGKYRGYIIKYDWSNQYAISSTALDIEINYNNNILSGSWQEDKNTSIPFQAVLSNNNLLFMNTTYTQKAHYHPKLALPFSFQNAKVQWQKINDSITLSGTIQMFSDKTNEPQKPQYIYLTKYESTSNVDRIQLYNDDGSIMRTISNLAVYPNPFTNIVKVDFENKETQNVKINLVTIDGKTVYDNDLGILNQGTYSIEVLPSQTLLAGVYIVKMQFNKKTISVKIVKQ